MLSHGNWIWKSSEVRVPGSIWYLNCQLFNFFQRLKGGQKKMIEMKEQEMGYDTKWNKWLWPWINVSLLWEMYSQYEYFTGAKWRSNVCGCIMQCKKVCLHNVGEQKLRRKWDPKKKNRIGWSIWRDLFTNLFSLHPPPPPPSSFWAVRFQVWQLALDP